MFGELLDKLLVEQNSFTFFIIFGLAIMGNDYHSLNNLHSLPENFRVDDYDHSFDPHLSALRSSN
jgi:hypothetical protein